MCFLNGQLVLLKAGDDPALPRNEVFAEPNMIIGFRQLSGYEVSIHYGKTRQTSKRSWRSSCFALLNLAKQLIPVSDMQGLHIF
jgi:hypothetical protein